MEGINRMKYVLILSAVLLSGCATDKVLHFGAGAATAMYVEHVTGSKLKACAASLAVGIAKEVIDDRTHEADEKDVYATAIGCSVTYAF